MAFVAGLEAHLRMISTEAKRKYPIVKDAAERAMFKVRLLSSTSDVAGCDDILKTYLLACELKNTKLSILGLVGMEKLIAHDAVLPSALPSILATLKEHADMSDEFVQLKTLQTALTILQSQLHPTDEDQMSIILGLCLRLLGNSRNPDSVRSTAVATLRQGIALIFNRVLSAEDLPTKKLYGGTSSWASSFRSVAGEVSHSISASNLAEIFGAETGLAAQARNEPLSEAGRLGVWLFEDLTSLAGGGQANWLQVSSLQRTLALDMLEFVLSNYAVVFKKLSPFEQVLRHQVCSLLMTSLPTSGELDPEVGEPGFRRLVLRSVATVTRLYVSIVPTECEVFVSMLIKSTALDLYPWHQIMVLEVLRGFCVEARMFCLLFQTFDMKPENTNMVANMVQALAQIVMRVQMLDGGEDTLVAVAGMVSCKAQGVEWTMETDGSGVGSVVANEAQAIFLALEALLAVVFSVATLTDEALDSTELVPPVHETTTKLGTTVEIGNAGGMVAVCKAMINSLWHPLLEALSFMLEREKWQLATAVHDECDDLILCESEKSQDVAKLRSSDLEVAHVLYGFFSFDTFSRSQGEVIVGEVLKGYQAFTKACGILAAIEPRDTFLASLGRFTFSPQMRANISWLGAIVSGMKRLDPIEQREAFVLSNKNVQALRTLFNISYQLNSVLGPTSWILVMETLEVLDVITHSPYASSQEVLSSATRTQSNDVSVLAMYDAQVFESSGKMSTLALSFFLAALRQVSNSFVSGLTSPNFSTTSSPGANTMTSQSTKMFGVERMLLTLMVNEHRLELVWDQLSAHLLELVEHDSQQVHTVALDALDRAICGVLGCQRFSSRESSRAATVVEKKRLGRSGSGSTTNGATVLCSSDEQGVDDEAFECALITPLSTLYYYGRTTDIRSGALKILLHVLERHGEKLHHSWPIIFELLRSVANASERDVVPLGFQNLKVIMNDGLLSIPANTLGLCIEVAGAYGAQRTDVNISLTAIGSLWTTADFFARGVNHEACRAQGAKTELSHSEPRASTITEGDEEFGRWVSKGKEDTKGDPNETLGMGCDAFLLAVYGVIQSLGTDERPEVRHSAIRTLFQSLSSHGHKLTLPMWKRCLWNLVFPLVDTVRHLASTSSKDQWHGKELGTEGGKPVHMLVHHSRNTAQKQWDETLVLVLGGMGRLLRPHFKILHRLDSFKQGWDSFLTFVQESVLNGSEEVAVAAIMSMHSVLVFHDLKVMLPGYYFESAFSTYETIAQSAVRGQTGMASKVQKELWKSLGDLYANGHSLFGTNSYVRILALVDLFIWAPIATVGKIPFTILAILPTLKPNDDHLLGMWPVFLHQVLSYLPGGNNLRIDKRRFSNTLEEGNIDGNFQQHHAAGKGSILYTNGQSGHLYHQVEGSSIKEGGVDGTGSLDRLPPDSPQALKLGSLAVSMLFSEKLIPVLMALYESTPADVAATVLPEIVGALGRCMATRRDAPTDGLWRTSTNALVTVLRGAIVRDSSMVEKVNGRECSVSGGTGTSRLRFWKEVADTYEKFVVGACGRAVALSTGVSETLEEDELLEYCVLNFLCDELLTSCQDAPHEVIQRLVSVIDQCAARTSALPLESVALLPAHCGRFSMTCLEKLFKLCSCDKQQPQESSRVVVSRISITILIGRCKAILHHFADAEREVGETSVPQMTTDEVVFVLRELAKLVLHPVTADALHIPLYRREESKSNHLQTSESGHASTGSFQVHQKLWDRGHLLLLYTSLCELVTTRVLAVTLLLQPPLQLVGSQLGL